MNGGKVLVRMRGQMERKGEEQVERGGYELNGQIEGKEIEKRGMEGYM